MNWIQSLSRAIHYIKNNLTGNICIDEISNQAHTSSSYLQLIFHVVMGLTVGEYIRNRRLSLAAQDLLQRNSKTIDVPYEIPAQYARELFRGVYAVSRCAAIESAAGTG